MKPAGLEAPGGQAPPPEDEDRISHLPDAVLGDIISLLPTKEGARTQILATRWRHLWGSSSAPLNLDCNALRRPGGSSDIVESAVSSILSAHPGPGRRFCLDETRRPYPRSDEALADSWLSSPALHNLQHLELRHNYTSSYPSYHRPPPPPPLRATAFRFARTLRVATFGNCTLPSSPPHFPNLKLLTLEKASISDCSLRNMISQCPILECLLLHDVYGIPCARISSQSLKSIGVRFGWFRASKDHRLEELVIEDAPSLEKLLNLNVSYALHVTVVSAPKLEILGYVSDFRFGKTKFVFGSTIIQFFMKKEILCRFGSCWLPKKPTLDIPLKLKKIVLDRYQGTYSSGCRGNYSEVEFAKFFVLNATLLESMIFRVEAEQYNKKFFERERMALQYEKRASKAARYHFTTDRRRLREVGEFNHASDLDLTDPFLRRTSSGSFWQLV
ncbi:hypothetical protein ACQ4PT_031718 [Festuca glaucescens]